MKNKNKKKSFICFCNGIDQKTIERAILDGANTMDEVFDLTTAGVGACGGSCRPLIKTLIDQYQQTNTFPELQRATRKQK